MKARTMAMLVLLGIAATRPVESSRHLSAYIDVDDNDDDDDTDWEDPTVDRANRKELDGYIGIRG